MSRTVRRSPVDEVAENKKACDMRSNRKSSRRSTKQRIERRYLERVR